jgi:uncharacterized protein (TIGR02145 family)
LKSKTGWNSSSGITNEDTYGFSALPGGFYYGGGFNNAGDYGDWWTATEYDSGIAYYRSMFYDSDFVVEDWNYKYYGFSVRCVGD